MTSAMNFALASADAVEIAAAVKARSFSAVEVTKAALSRIAEADPILNCFTALTEERALAEAALVDFEIAAGRDPGPLAGVPFAVKNLLDVEGMTTIAGSILRSKEAPAKADAFAVGALQRAGAILVGALNMDEFAYGFTTENTHYGPTRNPHDPTRVAGGSSGGSAAAVASGMIPIALGSDTNGSIRVPAAFCGIFGLKPTYGRVSRNGAFLFVASLDHIGPFARSVEDLATSFDALQGFDADDPVCTIRPPAATLPELKTGTDGLRIAVAGTYFQQRGDTESFAAVNRVARALNTDRVVEIPEAGIARAAAYVITAAEGGAHHLPELRKNAHLFDPLTRSRFLAGTLVPAAWVNHAQRFRSWYRNQVADLFNSVDVILAPATPCEAITIGQEKIVLDGEGVPARPNIGIYTQPISFIGLPVVTVPVHVPGQLPRGVQLIGAPYSEAKLLRAAYELQRGGIVAAPVARGYRKMSEVATH